MLWAADFGSGHAWLAERNGREALPLLLRALELAHRTGSGMERSRYLPLTHLGAARAHGLAGDAGPACEHLGECLSDAAGADRPMLLKLIVEQPDLEGVRRALPRRGARRLSASYSW